MSKDKEYRAVVMTHLEYIAEKVESNNKELKRLNGRISKNENAITKIFAIGSTLSFLFTLALTYLGVKK